MNALKISIVLTFAFLLWFSGTALAQKGKSSHADGPAHSHKSHNGGTVKSAGDYHIELVDKKGQYHIYLLDIEEKPVKLKGVTGLAILRDGDRTVHTQSLAPTSAAYFSVATNGIDHNAVLINFTVNQKNITAKFTKDGAQAMNFYCPQKCTGSDSNLAGVCPQCGNALADRRLLAKE
jgi:hypothetical protein